MDTFYEDLQKIYNAQLRRVKKNRDVQVMSEVDSEIMREKLSPSFLRNACRDEVLRICKAKYDENIGSNRLEGHGWNKAHVISHMERFLRQLMDRQKDVFRRVVSKDDS
jgi:hypothetical protein